MWHWWGFGVCQITREGQPWMNVGGLFKERLPILLWQGGEMQRVGEVRPYHKHIKAGLHIYLSDIQYTLLSKGFSGQRHVLSYHRDYDAKEAEVLLFKGQHHYIQCLRHGENLISAFPNPENPQAWWFEWDHQDKELKQEGHVLALVFALLARERHWLMKNPSRA